MGSYRQFSSVQYEPVRAQFTAAQSKIAHDKESTVKNRKRSYWFMYKL
jgi:hypothetical protein